MAELSLALPTIWVHEGRYVNSARDPGGATNYGISLRFLLGTGDLDQDGWQDGDIDQDGDVDVEDIKAMNQKDAEKLYDIYFWSKGKYSQFVDQDVATKVFDLAINMGLVGAHKCLQRANRAATGIFLVEDGVLGKKSFDASNNAPPKILLAALKSEAAGYYRSIKYQGSEDYLKGWLNRAYSDAVLQNNLR